ncbi:hypothetical protein [Streptomyces sp. NPDC046985]|uniref:hypothetical protein n=1 Tax=Streptomyces sp. NPDC046985 TaxID=3155377 RepID=UPI0033D7FB24
MDIVQMVGRALRMAPGAEKIATLIVPVFLGRDEDANELLNCGHRPADPAVRSD